MFNRKIKYIELIFENCEVAKLTPDMFKYCRLYGVKDIIDINSYQYKNGEYEIHKTCDYFYIEILPKGLQQILSLEEITLKERLERHNDITSVSIIYENNKEINYYVPWPEKEDFTNTYQVNKLGFEKDSLCIQIEERKMEVK